MRSPFHDHEVHVREIPLPGTARLFSMTLADGSIVTLSTRASSTDRTLEVTPPDSDESVVAIHFNAAESTTLAALLSGIRFVIQQPEEDQPVDAASLRTVTLPAGSPAIGLRLHDIEVPDSVDARVIAVIRDDTADLIESDPERPCQAGDRLVIVGRPGAMSLMVQQLTG
ncbi:MAG TPA: TrkA C-terminal domain-containing protein [Ilumatobacter sp.]|nr:TrkA C-terminal domain-containing protein [Ilumatobacter sp.]